MGCTSSKTEQKQVAKSCCPPGSHGRAASHYLESKGKMETWNLDGKDIAVYTVGPVDAKSQVLVVHDVFSLHEGRAKACCDFLAD